MWGLSCGVGDGRCVRLMLDPSFRDSLVGLFLRWEHKRQAGLCKEDADLATKEWSGRNTR